MRLGAPVFRDTADPRAWAAEVRRNGYTAAYCPLDGTSDAATVRAFASAASAANVVISEVGAWHVSPLSPDPAERRRAIAFCQQQLALADAIGARCCVNVAGSRGDRWDGPHAMDLAPDALDMIVQVAREIIDGVRPVRAQFALETMPWMLPDSPDSCVAMVAAVDRAAFGIHLDPVNMINSPRRFLDNAGFLRECFARIGPRIVCVHAKDVIMTPDFITHLSEVQPGLGRLDYATFLREANKLDPDLPIMLEHLETEPEYLAAAAYVRGVAQHCGLAWQGA